MRPALYSGSSGPTPHPRPQPQQRGPLPPFDMAGPYTVHTTLPSNLVIPASFDKNFCRGNFSAVTIPGGLPWVPRGTSSVHPERCLTWFLDEYAKRDSSAPDRILQEHAKRGYSHYLMSRGGGFGLQPPSFYAQQAAYVKSYGFYVCHMLTSKTTDASSQPVPYYINQVRPYLDAILEANACDIVSLGWELNLFWIPDELQKFKEWLRGYIPATVTIAAHFSTFVTAWQQPGHPRADFYADGIVKQLWYQTDPNANLGTMQAHANDALVPASGLQANGVRPVWFEVKAQAMFDGPATEDDGDMYGFGGLCTPGPIAFNGGFFNGARYPDGRVI